VVTSEGTVVAELPILEGGYLMTTAVYGASLDDTNGESNGMVAGTEIFLAFRGERISEAHTWMGDMSHLKLEVEVALEAAAMTAFPNPAADHMELRWEQNARGVVAFEVFDALGRTVLSEVLGAQEQGMNTASFSVGSLAPGAYTLHLKVDGRTVHQLAIQRVK
jgi:hypothetical protein